MKAIATTTTEENGFWDRMFKGELEENRFGIISIVLLIIGCLGGIVMWSGALLSTGQMILTVIPTMTVLSLLLAVQPLKWLLNTTVLLLFIDISLIIYNLATL